MYFSEGAPIGFLWWALPTRLRAAGVAVPEIAAVAGMLAVPWALKFLWAPAVDVLQSPRWGLRSWITTAQVVMGLTLAPLLLLDLNADFRIVFAVCLTHAFAAATQDVAVDALAVRVIPEDERGTLTAWMQGGMLAGRSLFGGGALLLGGLLGAKAVILLMIAAIWSSLLLLRLSDDEIVMTVVAEEKRSFLEALRAAFARRDTWLGLGFALISGAGFELAGAVAGPFLLDHGLTKQGVGAFLSLPVVGAMLAGAFAGGRLSDRFGRRRAAGATLIATSLSVLTVAAAAAAGAGPSVLVAAFAGLYLCIGLFTAASYALFMDLTDPRLGATQFSAYMGATNACESWSASAGGRLIASSGYAVAFSVMALISLAALPFLRERRGSPPTAKVIA